MNKNNEWLIVGILVIGIIFLGPQLGLFSTVITDDDVVRGEISSPMTISKGNQIFELTDLYLEDTTINKGTADFTQSYNNGLVGHVKVLSEPCAYGMMVTSYQENLETGIRIRGNMYTTGDYRNQQTGDIIRRTPQTGDSMRAGARYYERHYFNMENGEYETIVKVECRITDITEQYQREVIGEVRTGIITTITGESLLLIC